MSPPVPPMLEGHVCWILGPDGRTPVAVDLARGAAWMNAHGPVRVALDAGPSWEVSTVFLARFVPEGVRPDPFETRLRRRGAPNRTEPGATWEEAEGNHLAAVAALARPDPLPRPQ